MGGCGSKPAAPSSKSQPERTPKSQPQPEFEPQPEPQPQHEPEPEPERSPHSPTPEHDAYTVHVGGLDMYTDEDQRASYETELTELFGEFGTVRAAQVRVRQGGWTDGVQKHSWALVTFSLPSEAQAAIADAALRLAQRAPSSTHRLQGATKLGALQRTMGTIGLHVC
jgi:hypothetical protein